jgi:hypothetical protein
MFIRSVSTNDLHHPCLTYTGNAPSLQQLLLQFAFPLLLPALLMAADKLRGKYHGRNRSVPSKAGATTITHHLRSAQVRSMQPGVWEEALHIWRGHGEEG